MTTTLRALKMSGTGKSRIKKAFDCPLVEDSGKGLAVVFHPEVQTHMVLHIRSQLTVIYAPKDEAISFMNKLLQELDDWENVQTWNREKLARFRELEREFNESLPMDDDEDCCCYDCDIDDDDECDEEAE